MAPLVLPTHVDQGAPAMASTSGLDLSSMVLFHEQEAAKHLAAAEQLRRACGMPPPSMALPQAVPQKRKRTPRGCPKGVTPPGFVKKMRITSPALLRVLEHEASEPMPRQEVVHKLQRYIRDNGLQSETNKKMLDFSGDSDAARNVREMFEGQDTENLTFFSIQKLLRPLMEDWGEEETEASEGQADVAAV
jgi:hypothetical protein